MSLARNASKLFMITFQIYDHDVYIVQLIGATYKNDGNRSHRYVKYFIGKIFLILLYAQSSREDAKLLSARFTYLFFARLNSTYFHFDRQRRWEGTFTINAAAQGRSYEMSLLTCIENGLNFMLFAGGAGFR